MRNVTIIIHHEDDTWWAESPDMPHYYIIADTRQKIIDNLQDDIAFYCDESGDDLPTNIAVHDEDID